MAGLFSRLHIWNQDDNLTFDDLNNEFNNILANSDSQHSEGYSQNLSQMQAMQDPGAVGSENLTQPISQSDEDQRLRFAINRIIGGSQWYSAPPVNLTELQAAINTSNNLPTNYIASGAVDSFGQPDFIRANTSNVQVLASSGTPLNVVINGSSFSFTANITVSGLSSAPASQNTTTLNTVLSSDLASTAFGEKIFDQFYHGTILPINVSGYFPVTSTGTGITAKIGKLVAMKIAGVSSVTDYMIGRVFSSTVINGIRRGYFKDTSGVGTPRCALSGNETITLLELTYLFLSSGGAVTAVYNEPTYSPTTPAAPSTGDMWYDMTNKAWKIFNGTSFVLSNSLLIGICAQDSSGNCIVSRSGEIYGNYSSLNEVEADPLSVASSTSAMQSKGLGGSISVYGTTYTKLNNWIWDLANNMDTGQTAGSGNWFLYVSNLGQTYISAVAPNDRSLDLYGYYHPNKPWRCIGMALASSSTVWNSAIYNTMNFGSIVSENIPDQSISIYKIKSRLAAGNGANSTVGGFGLSGAIGSNSMSSGTLTQLGSISASLSTTGIRPVVVGVANGSVQLNTTSNAGGGTITGTVQIRNGSTVIGTSNFQLSAAPFGSQTMSIIDSIMPTIDLAASGSNTYTIWGAVSGTGASLSVQTSAFIYAYELI